MQTWCSKCGAKTTGLTRRCTNCRHNPMNNLYLIEYYTTHPVDRTQGGYSIALAWVYATDKSEAKQKLKARVGTRFDCFIQCEEHCEVFSLRMGPHEPQPIVIH